MEGWILTIVGAVSAVVCVVTLVRRQQVQNNGEYAEGTVTRSRRVGSNRSVWRVTVDFRTQDGRGGSLSCRTTIRGPEPGDNVPVYYLPDDPDRAVLADNTTIVTGVGVAVAVVMVCIGLLRM